MYYPSSAALLRCAVSLATAYCATDARAASELATPPAAFDRFTSNATVRVAQFPSVPFHVGVCRTRNARVTIRRDGTVSWRAEVRTRKPSGFFPAIRVRLIFIDRNQQRLFVFPFIDKAGLRDDFVTWERHNLAIPQHLFPFITAVVRNDRCED